MDKNYLENYKNKIANLNVNEKKMRTLYLKDLSIGKRLGPATGYSSIDMKWLFLYDDKSVNALINYEEKDESMYESLLKFSLNNKNMIAFNYLGRDFTYSEVIKNIDEVSQSLVANGVKEKDVVPIVLPNMPEARYLIYACSKIGAIPNPIMPTVSDIDLKTIIDNTKCKRLFVMDGLKDKFKQITSDANINDEKVVEVSPLRSAGGLLSVINSSKNLFKKSDFDAFISNGCNTDVSTVHGKANDIALIEQTGGTTALTTKGVLITNGNVLASSYQLENGGFNFEKGDSLLDILLPSISYGAAFEHLTLCNGIKNHMIPTLVKEDINKLISKKQPNHVMMGPIHFEFICKDSKNRNWKCLKNIVSGGDSMSLVLENDSNEKLKKNKASISLEQGYGESECFGAAACNHNDYIKSGSVGVPHLLTKIAVFDYNDEEDDYTTDLELQNFTKGELCISSPVIMKEYLNNKKASDLVIKEHSDGTRWLHTGDIGYMDDDGYVFITDRIKDLIFRNGFKVSPQKINKSILTEFENDIDICTVIGVKDDVERNVPIFFYKLKDDSETNKEKFNIKLNEFYKQNLSDMEIPKESIELSNFPRTGAGKVDKKTIKKQYLNEKTLIKR